MREELRNRFIDLILTGDQAKEVLLGISRAIGIGTDDGYYLSGDDFESLLLDYTKEC